MSKIIQLKNLDFADFTRLYNEGKIPVLYYDVRGFCDLRCIYCNTDAGKSDDGELNLDELKSVLEQCRDLGTKFIGIAGKGEPINDPKFLPALKYSHELGMTTIVFTNGVAIDKSIAKTLYENSANPVVKIDSFNPDVYDQLVGVKGRLDLTLKGLENLMNAGYRTDVIETKDKIITRIGISSVVTKLNYNNIPEIAKYCKENKLAPFFSPLDLIGRAIQNYDKLYLNSESNMKIHREVSGILGYPYDSYSHEDCLRRRLSFAMDNKGNVISDQLGNSCYPIEQTFIGNVKETLVKELYIKLRALRGSKALLRPAGKSGSSPRNFEMCPLQHQLGKKAAKSKT